jgi:hypothetical protein
MITYVCEVWVLTQLTAGGSIHHCNSTSGRNHANLLGIRDNQTLALHWSYKVSQEMGSDPSLLEARDDQI